MHWWPVIHLSDTKTALDNARLALNAGANGVFLIHMQGMDDLIEPVAERIRVVFPTLLLGANYLSLSAIDGLNRALAAGLDMSWSDAPGVRGDGASDMSMEMALKLAAAPDHVHFGAVAFKYQALEPDPGQAALRALSLGMLPTTSGTATGVAPDTSKLAFIRQAIGPRARLAIASGADIRNIASLAPFVSDVLVSTGISKDEHHFCPTKIYAFGRAVRSL